MQFPRKRLARELLGLELVRTDPSLVVDLGGLLREDHPVPKARADAVLELIGDVVCAASHEQSYNCLVGLPSGVSIALAESVRRSVCSRRTGGQDKRVLRLMTADGLITGFSDPFPSNARVICVSGCNDADAIIAIKGIVEKAKRVFAGAVVLAANPDELARLKAAGINAVSIFSADELTTLHQAELELEPPDPVVEYRQHAWATAAA